MIRVNLLPVREVAREAGRRQDTRLLYLSAALVVVSSNLAYGLVDMRIRKGGGDNAR